MTDTSTPFAEGTVRLPLPAEGSGTYTYLHNGEPSGVTESFEVTDGGRQVRSERRAPDGVRLAAEARLSDDTNGQCRLSIEGGALPAVQVLYMLTAGRLRVRHMADGRFVDAEFDPGGDAVISPLLRVFQGQSIAATIAAGGEARVVVPALDPADPDSLLTATVQTRRAGRRGVEAPDPSAEHPGLRHCSYVGGNYTEDADFWLDERDRLVRYRFPQSSDELWEIELTED